MNGPSRLPLSHELMRRSERLLPFEALRPQVQSASIRLQSRFGIQGEKTCVPCTSQQSRLVRHLWYLLSEREIGRCCAVKVTSLMVESPKAPLACVKFPIQGNCLRITYFRSILLARQLVGETSAKPPPTSTGLRHCSVKLGCCSFSLPGILELCSVSIQPRAI